MYFVILLVTVMGFWAKAKGAATRTTSLMASHPRRDAGPNDRIVVFGSFTTVAEALRFAR